MEICRVSFRADLFSAARDEAEVYGGSDPDTGLAHFLKTLFAPGPIVWRGQTWESLSGLAGRMVRAKSPEAYGEVLQKRVVSYWLEHTTGIERNEQNLQLVKRIEEAADAWPKIACYWFGFAFCEDRKISTCGQEVRSLHDWFATAFSSPKKFYAEKGLFEGLMDADKGAAVYGFLASFGCWDRLRPVLERAASMSPYDRFSTLFVMLESIGESGKADVHPLRAFHLKYGPLAPFYWTVCLQQQKQVYKGRTPAGKRMVQALEKVKLPEPGPVAACREAMETAKKCSEDVRLHMQGNVFLASSGIFEGADIFCGNVQGYFCFPFLGMEAPLILEAVLEENAGLAQEPAGEK